MKCKRPLCLFSLIFMFLVFIYSTTQNEDNKIPVTEGQIIYLEGDVISKEYRKGSCICHIAKPCLYDPDKNIRSEYFRDSDERILKVLCYMSKESSEPSAGSHVKIKGTVRCFERASNEGQYDELRAYNIKGYAFKMSGAFVLQESGDPDFIREKMCLFKRKTSEYYTCVLGEEAGGVLAAMILGEKGNMDTRIKDLYRSNGIAHMLAISGLHISLIGLFFVKLLKKAGAGYFVSSFAGIIVIISYGVMAGFSVSILRASVMLVLRLIADIAGRTYDILTALAFSGIIVLLMNFRYLYDAGFLLSFIAVLGLSLLNDNVMNILETDNAKQKGIVHRIKQSISVSVSVSLSTIPILLYSFYSFPSYSLLLNLILIPTFSIVLISGIWGGMVRIPLILYPAGGLLKIYEYACLISARLPGSRIVTGRPRLLQIIIYYLLIALFVILSTKEKKRFMSLIPLAAALMVIFIPRNPGTRLDMLSVGQGDMIFISDGKGHNCLYDAGSSDIDQVGKYRLLPYLKYNGVKRIDAVFLSHPHLDHYSGLIELFDLSLQEGIDIETFYVGSMRREDYEAYRNIFDSAGRAGITIKELNSNEKIRAGSIIIQAIYPEGSVITDDPNDTSLVLLAGIDDFDALLTGDITSEKDKELIDGLNKAGIGHVDCLKVCHHGSANANSEILIKRLMPKCSIISCGQSYGHPHKDVIKRLRDAGSFIYVTKDLGQIRIKIGRSRFSVCNYPSV